MTRGDWLAPACLWVCVAACGLWALASNAHEVREVGP